jgi:hypothetical protein
LTVRDIELGGVALQEHRGVGEQLGAHLLRRAEDCVGAHDRTARGERAAAEGHEVRIAEPH